MKNSMKITDRIKLMMSNDNKKTLNENLQENNITNDTNIPPISILNKYIDST